VRIDYIARIPPGIVVPPPSERSYINASADRRLMYKMSPVSPRVTQSNLTKFVHDVGQFIAFLTRP